MCLRTSGQRMPPVGGSRLHVCGVLLHQGDIGAVLGDIGAVCAGGTKNDIMKIFDMSASRGDVCQPLNNHHPTPDNTRQHPDITASNHRRQHPDITASSYQ